MTNEPTYREYWDDVSAIAEELAQTMYDSPGSELYDGAHESVDGSEWIIYYYRAHKVMEYTANRGAYCEQGLGQDTSGLDYDQVAVVHAFWSMYQDVLDGCSELLPDDWEDIELRLTPAADGTTYTCPECATVVERHRLSVAELWEMTEAHALKCPGAAEEDQC